MNEPQTYHLDVVLRLSHIATEIVNAARAELSQLRERLREQTQATQQAATYWHDRVLAVLNATGDVPDVADVIGTPIDRLVGLRLSAMKDKVAAADAATKPLQDEIEKLRIERDNLKTDLEGIRYFQQNWPGELQQVVAELKRIDPDGPLEISPDGSCYLEVAVGEDDALPDPCTIKTLLDDLRNIKTNAAKPETVADVLGWWFGRSNEDWTKPSATSKLLSRMAAAKKAYPNWRDGFKQESK